MSNNLTFINEDWLWPVVIGSALVFALFVWKEWTNSSKKRLPAKLVVSLISIGCLALITLKPAVLKTLETGRAVLITEGFKQHRLDSLLKTHKNLKKLRYVKNKPIQRLLDSVSSLFVLGHGPEPFDFWQFENIPTTYLGGTSLSGITKLKYDNKAFLGSKLNISALYNGPQRGNQIVLQNPGGIGLDSITLQEKPSQNFNLSADLKVKGNFVYKLTEKDSTGGVINSEPLPISVDDKTSLKTLMINSFPTFESKYLKNYLAEMNHEVLVRSQLTKGKYKFEYFNRARTPIYGVSLENLRQFDILIIDANSYKNLSSKAYSALLETVKVYGLGIFIQPDAGLFRLSKGKSHFDFIQEQSTEIQLERWPKLKLGRYPFKLNKTFLTEPVHTSQETTVSAYKRLGKGRVGTTVLQNTYQLVLDGQASVYKQLWSEIIGAISNRRVSEVEWKSETKFAVQHRPYDFKVRTSTTRPEVADRDGNLIPLIQNPDFPNLWIGTTYPRKLGWNQLKIKEDSTTVFGFYVFDSTQLQFLTTTKKIDANKRKFSHATPKLGKMSVLQPFNSLWFFLIFLLGMCWLWLEPKLFGH